MKIVSVKIFVKGGEPVVHKPKQASGLFVDVAGGVMISERNETNGFHMIAWYSPDIVTKVIPEYK
jgi:hypothetical protein